MATPVYSWKETDKAKAAAPTSFMDPQTNPYAGAPSQPKPEQAAGAQAAPAATGGYGGTAGGFAALGAAAPADAKAPSFSDAMTENPFAKPLVTSASQAIMQNLSGQPVKSFGDTLARNKFITSADEATRKVMEQSAGAGRAETGQLGGDAARYLGSQVMPQRANLEATLADQAQTRADTKQQAAIGQANNMAGTAQTGELAKAQLAQSQSQFQQSLAEQAKQFKETNELNKTLGLGDLNLREKTLAQAGQQFGDELAFKKYATDKGYTDAEAQRAWQATQNEKEIASREKLGFADLNVREKELAQKGQQFNDELSFKKFATEGGWSQQEADRAWKSLESDKDRSLTKSESALGRELEKYIAESGLALDSKKFEESIRQFNSREEFDKSSLAANLDEAQRDRIWKSNESDVARKWETGERMSTQDHQINLTRIQGEVDKDKASFNQVLGVQTMEKQAQIDAIAAEQANSYQTLRDTRSMSHDQAMETMKAGLTAKLEQAGYDHATAMQAAEIHARAVEGAQDREMATLEAKAELAYKYNALASEEGISREQIAARKEESIQQLSLGLQQLGLDTKKYESTIKSQDFQDRAGMLSTMMEMAGDNQDVIDRAAQGYLSLLKEKGMITEEQYKTGIEGVQAGAPAPSEGGSVPYGGPFAAIGNGLSTGAKATKSFFSSLW